MDSTDAILDNHPMMKRLIKSLSSIPLFSTLSSEELKNLAKYMFFLDYQEGDVVFKEGDKGSYMCFLIEGSLSVSTRSKGEGDTELSIIEKGRPVGEMAVIDDFPRSATVRAKTNSRLLTLSRKNFESLLENHPETGIKVLKGIARLVCINLRRTSVELADLKTPVI
ncbi:MAG: cyclic nucleotide-binding domain-containing protein [Deltaproteobacteria bacterium]|nr:cyclic nucleotide-binding domain-containing protein [Deltaproteobacteria bacterium]